MFPLSKVVLLSAVMSHVAVFMNRLPSKEIGTDTAFYHIKNKTLS